MPGDPVALEAIESELRYLAKRLDNNAAEDEKAKQLQETRDEQQDELIKMEFLKIKREVEKCAQSSDVRKVKNALTEKLDELLEDASLIARQQCELSTENFQQDITSLSKISEKSMHAVDTLEARCVELESKLADYDVRHSDLASASSKLAMEQKRIDEAAEELLQEQLKGESRGRRYKTIRWVLDSVAKILPPSLRRSLSLKHALTDEQRVSAIATLYQLVTSDVAVAYGAVSYTHLTLQTKA